MSRHAPLYTDERRSIYNHAADSYESTPHYMHYYMRARSTIREPSGPRHLRAQSAAPVTAYRSFHAQSIGREHVIYFWIFAHHREKLRLIAHKFYSLKEIKSQLENANKSYHDYHAEFLSKRWENKHHLYSVQDTVRFIFWGLIQD
jgi:hypothetical protein